MQTAVMTYMHEFYFESAAMILTLITVGQDAGGAFQGKDDRCVKGPDEAGTEDRGCAFGTAWKSTVPH